VGVNVRLLVSTRWIHELAVPGSPDISSVWASYILALLHAVFAALALLNSAHSVEYWLIAAICVGLQLPLLFGITVAMVRASLPPPTGRAAMFPDPEPLASVRWFIAFGGVGVIAVAWILFAAST
jgi:hypothetical protein